MNTQHRGITMNEANTTDATPDLGVSAVNNLEAKALALDQPAQQQRTVSAWKPVDWTPDRVELLRKTYAATATAEEFEFFVEWCRQTGLNPFLRHAYFIERWDAQRNLKRHEPMVSEQGFAARADALADFGGMRSGVVYKGDTFAVNEVTQEIVHEWDEETRIKNGRKVLGAWAHAVRHGRVIEITYLTFESRAQYAGKGSERRLTKFWNDDPAGQIRKCARADQYRRGWPGAFSNMYDPAEFNDEIEINAAPPAPKSPTGKTDALRDRLKRTQTVDAPPPPAKKAAPKASPPAATSSAPPLDCIRFGPKKGTKLSELTTIELEEAIAIANEGLAKAKGNEAWIPSTKDGITAAYEEIDRRINAAKTEPAPLDETPPPEGEEPF